MKKEKIIIIIIALIISALMIGGKILMNEEKVYGYCGSKCKHEVIEKDNLKVIELTSASPSGGSIVYGTEYEVYHIETPEGFTENNSVILSEMYDSSTIILPTSDNGIESPITFTYFSDNTISLYIKSGCGIVNYKIVLYRYKD